MTSRNLFFNLQMEDLKKRLWTISLSMLVFFLGLPVFGAARISSYKDNIMSYNGLSGSEYMKEQLLHFMSPSNELLFLITIVGAVICGLSSFFYLHSRKKVDLYHSIPVRRELLFGVNFIDGILIYLLPYLFNLVLSFIVLQVNGFMNISLFVQAFKSVGVNIVFFTLLYSVVVMAVMFTGNLVISCFGTAVFFLYGPLISLLTQAYGIEFFKTFYAYSDIEESLMFLSPVGIYMGTVRNWGNDGFATRMIMVTLTTIALICFLIFLYKKRPSEAAGKAMSINITKPIIKFLLVIPLTLGGGILFRSIATVGSTGWFIFGLLFSFFLIYGIIEIIYHFDIRKAFSYKIQLLICASVTIIIACIYQFDIIHYDNYLPQKSDVKSMSVAITGIDDYQQYYYMDNNYNGNVNYQLETMKLTDFEAAYELAKDAVNQNGAKMESNTIDNNDTYFSYNVKYTMKSGREIYRVYYLSATENKDNIIKIYENDEFKQGHYPVFHLDVNKIRYVSSRNNMETKEFSLDDSEKEQLLKIYREDLNNLTIQELESSQPVATLVFNIERADLSNCDVENNIYSSFTNTITFLKDHGFDVSKQMEAKDVINLTVDYYPPIESEEIDNQQKSTQESVADVNQNSVTYTDQKDISKILPLLVESDYANQNNTILNMEYNVNVSVSIGIDEYGNYNTFSYYFTKDNIPEFVQEAIGYKK